MQNVSSISGSPERAKVYLKRALGASAKALTADVQAEAEAVGAASFFRALMEGVENVILKFQAPGPFQLRPPGRRCR
jgi:hypothetical protein